MRNKTILMIAVILMMSGSLLPAQGYGNGRGGGNGGGVSTTCVQLPSQDVDENEKEALVWMREEEKLARDVYLTLYKKWNSNVFINIANSEAQHTEAIRMFLEKYWMPDPVQNYEVGVFTNPDLRNLFESLTAQGEASLLDAFIVGATIEDLDIFDLNEAISETDNDDIKCVYNNLKQGSENHMRSFVRQIEMSGGTYKAQFISQEELNEILGIYEASAGESVLYFPQFVSGEGADTEFFLVNNCAEEASGSIIYYSGESGDAVRTDSLAIPARNVLVHAWKGEAGETLQAGAVEIIQEDGASCSIEGTEFINVFGSYTTVNNSSPRNSHQLFVQRNGDRDTGFAMYNPGSKEVTIDIFYISGDEETEATVVLGPNGHRSMFLGELMSGLPEETAGTLNFFADGDHEFVVMGLVFTDRASNAMVSVTAGPGAYRGTTLP